jgi:hypothetical protein
MSPGASHWPHAALAPCIVCGLLLSACSPGSFDGLAGGDKRRDAASPGEASQPNVDAADLEDAASPTDSDANVLGDASGEAGSSDASGFDAEAGTANDASVVSDSASGADASVDASDAGDAGAPDAGPVTRSFVIAADQDDAVWRSAGANLLEELLHFSQSEHGSAGYTIEVGVDGEQCRAGLRFQLPIARGARIVSADLTLTRVGPESNVDAADSMRVFVYDADDVGPFDHAHAHAMPDEHVGGGLWARSVGGYHVGASNARTTSGDLSALLQRVVDRLGWTRGSYVGFVLVPDQMAAGAYAQFADVLHDQPAATLRVTYFDAP